MRLESCTLFAVLVLVGTAVAAPNSREDKILIMGNVSGSQTVADEGRAEYSFNDRGRGDHITATWKLDAAGVPTEYSGNGNDYMKAPVTESFHLVGGKGSWQSRNEHGERAVTGESFYMPNNAPPEFTGVLARALLKAPGHKLALLPGGEARLTAAGSVTVPGLNGAQVELTQYQISGLDFSPTPVWLAPDGHTAAVLNGWFSIINSPYVTSLEPLANAQKAADQAWSANLAKSLTQVPTGDVVIHGARLFDPRDLSITPGMSVLIRSGHIVRVAPDTDLKASQGAQLIDAKGRFLMPGLWDNHQHFGNNDGALDLANGVTSARDMANDTDAFLERVARFDDGSELGPHVFKAGIIDGTSRRSRSTRPNSARTIRRCDNSSPISKSTVPSSTPP
jgi:hypothetical protein